MFTKPFIKTVCCLLWCAYAIHGTSQTTKGKDFWFGYMYNIVYSDNKPLALKAYVSSERFVSGTVTVQGTGFMQTFNVLPNSTSLINIPIEAMAGNDSDIKEKKAVHIVTCDTVSVYAISNGQNSSDAAVIYPTPALGNDYRIITSQSNLEPTDGGKQFLIVATENNSQIEIIPSALVGGWRPAGVAYTITLNQGDIYQVGSDLAAGAYNDGSDLTGTIVRSAGSGSSPCSNFAVFSGNRNTYIGECTYGDHIYEQLSPTKSWGKQFVIGKFARKKHLIFKLLAKANGTSFTVNGGPATTLNAGQYYTYSSTADVGPLYISANQPVMLMQFMAGGQCDADTLGDPDQVLIYPLEQTMNVATFYTIPSPIITKFYANVCAKTSAIANMKLNGNSIASSFTTVASNPLYSYARGIPLTQNTNYQLVSDTGFYAFVYGMGIEDSYSYPVGSSVKDLTNDFSITFPAVLCPGESWGFQAIHDPNATSYSWDYGDSSTGSGLTTSHTYNAEGTYSVTLTKVVPGTCPIKVAKWITVKKPLIKIRSIAGTGSTCQGPITLWTRIKTDTILIKIPVANCRDTIRYRFVNHLDSVRWSTGSRDSSITVSPSVTTKYYLYGYARGSSCLAVDSVIVNATNSYTTTITTSSASCLALGSATASTAGGTAPFSYTWTGSVSSSSVAVGLPAGHHTLTIADAGGCLQTHSFTISGSGSVTLAISGNTNICSGGSASLTASGALTYTWSGSVSSTSLAIVSPTTNTTYTVIGVDAVGCSGSQTVTVIVGGSIPMAISGNTNICSGSSASLTASGALTYSWSGSVSSTSLAIVSPTTNTTYTVIGADAAGCSGSQTVVVTVGGSIPIAISGNTNICSGNTASLTASGALTYTWSSGVSSTSLAIVSPTMNTTYTVIGMDAAGCSGSQTVTVMVGGSIPVTISGNMNICSGSSASLTASGALTYSWSGGVSSTSLAIVSPTTTASYTVIGADAAGCAGSQTVTVMVNTMPTLTVSGITTICERASTTLTAGGADSYSWSTTESGSAIIISPTTTTTYTVTGTNVAGCAGSQTVTVNVNPVPIVSTIGNTLTCLSPLVGLIGTGGGSYHWTGPGIVSGTNSANPMVSLPGSYTLTVTSANGCQASAYALVIDQTVKARAAFIPNPDNGTAPLTVLFTNNSTNASLCHWSFGDGSFSSVTNPEHVFLEEGQYTVFLIAGAGACADTTSMVVMVEPDFSFFAPNCISPNNDGINDVFTGKGVGIVSFDLWIFDRWGTNIFYSNDIHKGWDGSVKGKEPKQDVYTWKVNLTDTKGKKHNYFGHVSVLK